MSQLAGNFNALLSRMADHLKTQGLSKSAFSSTRKFKDLQDDDQKAAITRLRIQVEQIELLRPGMRDPEKLALISRYHKLRPVSEDIYERLEMEEPWEIIDFDLNQLYRNPLIFELGNYTIEDYETYSPWELFIRPENSLKNLMEITEKLKNSKTLIDLTHIPPYLIQEALSEAKAKYEISHHFVCPLVDSSTGENKAFVSAFRSKKIDPALQNKIHILN